MPIYIYTYVCVCVRLYCPAIELNHNVANEGNPLKYSNEIFVLCPFPQPSNIAQLVGP